MSNNVWVEAAIHPEDAKTIQTKTGILRPDKLHVTMAFTTLAAYDNTIADPLAHWTKKAFDIRSYLTHMGEGLPDSARVGGAAVFTPIGIDAVGVLLVQNSALNDLHSALVESLGSKNADTKYPFTPHVTVYEKCTSTERQVGALIDLAYTLDDISFDGLYLRAGRMCLPL